MIERAYPQTNVGERTCQSTGVGDRTILFQADFQHVTAYQDHADWYAQVTYLGRRCKAWVIERVVRRIRLGLPGRWPLADSRKATKREGARLEGNPGFRVREKAPRGVGFIVVGGVISRLELVTPARWPGRRGVAISPAASPCRPPISACPWCRKSPCRPHPAPSDSQARCRPR